MTGLAVERIRTHMASGSPADALHSFTQIVAQAVEASGFQAGGPLATVALETAATNDRLNQVCRAAYASMQSAFEDSLLAGGIAPAQAASLAVVILAGMEGAILLSRTYHSGNPLRTVGGALAQLVKAAQTNPT